MTPRITVFVILVAQIFAQRRRPNIILMVSDDQDVMLGSLQVMNNLREAVMQNGVEFENAFTTTPICCPSRSSMLTGLYAHNHHVYTNNDNCSSSLWQRYFETKSYATYLKSSGYHTGYFGKYLNEYNGSYTPPGWHYWMGLHKNSKYYNYTLLHQGQREAHGNNYAEDYLTDLVTNRSINFFKQSKIENRERPVLAVVSFPAPHGPEDGAPQYSHLYGDDEGFKTKSYDYVPNVDKHWIISQFKEKMDKDQHRFSQLLQQKRLQTLRSVDDGVKKIVEMLREIQELENTYLLYVSDHGYHIGQFGLPKGKSMPYDFDIRIPFAMRGPGIPRYSKMRKIALNIDVAPTILGMAGIPAPPDMDGRNLLDLFSEEKLIEQPWRDSFLIERGKVPRNKTHLVKPRKETKVGKLQKLCASPNYVYPCKKGQFWTCINGEDEKPRLQKCNKKSGKAKQSTKVRTNLNPKRKAPCPCPDSHLARRRGKNFIDEEINVLETCGKRGYLPMSHRLPRARGRMGNKMSKKFTNHLEESKKRAMANKSKFWKEERRRRYKRGLSETKYNGSSFDVHPSGSRSSIPLTDNCNLYMPNFEIRCKRNLYIDAQLWIRHMGRLARSVKTMQLKMKYMKTLRTCLNVYNQMKSKKLCDCPPSLPKQKVPKVNVSHPLMDELEAEERDYNARKLVYEKMKEVNKAIKEERQVKLQRKQKRILNGGGAKRCGSQGLTCFKLCNLTWVNEPRWDGEDKCYCTNANNNTYWCVRILNENTNALYCQFITGFREYYNLIDDPFQLVSTEMNLVDNEKAYYQNMIRKLRGCRGHANCTLEPFVNPFVNMTHPTQSIEAQSNDSVKSVEPHDISAQDTEVVDPGIPAYRPSEPSDNPDLQIDEFDQQQIPRRDARPDQTDSPVKHIIPGVRSRKKQRNQTKNEIPATTITRPEDERSQEIENPKVTQGRYERGRQRKTRRTKTWRARGAKAQKGSRLKKKTKSSLL